MALTEIGYFDSSKKELQGRQAGLQKRIKKSSARDPVEVGMPQAGPTPSDCEVELSILQSAYDRSLGAGLRAKKITTDVNGEPVLVLQLYGVRLCEVCGCWTMQTFCPACGPE